MGCVGRGSSWSATTSSRRCCEGESPSPSTTRGRRGMGRNVEPKANEQSQIFHLGVGQPNYQGTAGFSPFHLPGFHFWGYPIFDHPFDSLFFSSPEGRGPSGLLQEPTMSELLAFSPPWIRRGISGRFPHRFMSCVFLKDRGGA